MATYAIRVNGTPLQGGSFKTKNNGSITVTTVLSVNDQVDVYITPDEGEMPTLPANAVNLTMTQLRLN
jgi:hypothetical protein